LFKKKNRTKLSDAELVTLAKVNHVHFGVLYERYFETIFRFIFKRLGGDEANSGDLTQQTFLKAMSSLEKYEERGFPFTSWLYRIAQNEVNLFFRDLNKEVSIQVEERQINNLLEEANLGTCMSESDQEKLILQLNILPQESIDLIELRFFQELSFKEIADIYSISEANAKMRIYRILEKMNKNWNV
jgi:RNA polymerase sigma-70 factor (ECF subfamily)